jgi:hypothetical protein
MNNEERRTHLNNQRDRITKRMEAAKDNPELLAILIEEEKGLWNQLSKLK